MSKMKQLIENDFEKQVERLLINEREREWSLENEPPCDYCGHTNWDHNTPTSHCGVKGCFC